MNHVSLFSGVGGIDLAAEWAGFTTIAFCENDPYCQSILRLRWPGVPICEDVHDMGREWLDEHVDVANPQGREQPQFEEGDSGWSSQAPVTERPVPGASGRGEERGSAEGVSGCEGATPTVSSQGNSRHPYPVTLVSGGFPCQPFSVAGKRRGKEDDRYLWPEMLRVISELQPRWVLGENVAGFVRMGLDEALSDLEGLGYEVQPFIIPACAVGALHLRERVFIVGYAGQQPEGNQGCGFGGELLHGEEAGVRTAQGDRPSNPGQDVAHTSSRGLEGRVDGCKRFAEEGVRLFSTRPSESGDQISEHNGNHRWSAQPCVGRDTARLSPWLDGLRERWADGSWEHGIPRVATGVKDRVNRLKALGNAVVPQQVYPILRGIAEIERMSCG